MAHGSALRIGGLHHLLHKVTPASFTLAPAINTAMHHKKLAHVHRLPVNYISHMSTLPKPDAVNLPLAAPAAQPWTGPEEDTLLDFGNGWHLHAHSAALKLASQPLNDMLLFAVADAEGKYTLPVQGDSFSGWQQVLSLIDPSKPDLTPHQFTMEAAYKALRVADKYAMARPFARYSQHVQHTLLPSMCLERCLQWYNTFCYVCHEPVRTIKALLMSHIKMLLSKPSSVPKLAAYLKDTPFVMAGTAARLPPGKHPMAVADLTRVLLGMLSRGQWACSKCHAKFCLVSASEPPSGSHWAQGDSMLCVYCRTKCNQMSI